MFQHLQSNSFSEPIEQNADVITCFSPDGFNFACALQSQLLVWNVESKEVKNKFICDHIIDSLGWSPDSELIYCGMSRKNIIQIWSFNNPTWRCKISENPLSFVDVFWSPDSRHLLVVAEFHLKITVWSLVSSAIAVIENPKPIKNCLSFSHCERYLAVAERRKCEDYISIYTCDTWEILKFFSVDTKDLSGIYFSPSDLVLGIVEAFTEELKVVFYLIDGKVVGKYTRPSLFGLTCFSWNCNGNLITLGDYFGTVTILHSSNYDEIISYHEKESIECKNVVIYKVNQRPVKDEATSSNWELYAVIKDRPFNFGALVSQSEKTKTKPTCGVHTLKYSHCGQYLASLSGSLPKVVFIFDLNTFQLSSIIIHLYKIKDISWHPEKPVLAICSGSGNLDLWTSSCCISICSPFKGDLSIINAQWCTIKDCLLLNGKDRSTLLHLPDFSYENSTAIKK